jgi:DNA-binding NarL/FixJ family response regulator
MASIELLVAHHRGLEKRHHHRCALAVGHHPRINLPRRLRILPYVVEHSELLHCVNLQRACTEFGDGMEPSVRTWAHRAQRRVAGSHRHALERSRTALVHEAEMQQLRDCFASLIPGERDVMALVVSGLLNKQVGAQLGISEITVKAHRGHGMQEMKADWLADLVKMAEKLHLAVSPKG